MQSGCAHVRAKGHPEGWPLALVFPWRVYRSDAVNRSQAEALKVNVPPSRFAVSRTRTEPDVATSTQLPPLSE